VRELERDADAGLPWDLVELVYVFEESAARSVCAICLHAPRASHVTRCGHVFCLCCLLQLFMHGFQRCPLCSEALSRADLRPVSLCRTRAPALGGRVRMALVGRSRESLLGTHPVHLGDGLNASQVDSNGADVGTSSSASAQHRRRHCRFARVRKADHDVMLSAVVERIDALRDWRDDASAGADSSRVAQDELALAKTARNLLNRRLRIASLEEQSGGGLGDCGAATASRVENGAEVLQDDVLYFQAEDGQACYLHPWTARLLAHEHGGSLQHVARAMRGRDSCVEGTVKHVERHVMHGGARQRFRFLAHLPTGAAFMLCELALDGFYQLSLATMTQFAEQSAKRDRRREEDLRKQRRREKSYHALSTARQSSRQDTLREAQCYPAAMYGVPRLNPNDAQLEPRTFSLEAHDFPPVGGNAGEITTPTAITGEAAAPAPLLTHGVRSCGVSSLEPRPWGTAVRDTWSSGRGVHSAVPALGSSPHGSYAAVTGTAGGYFPTLGESSGLGTRTSVCDTEMTADVQPSQNSSGQTATGHTPPSAWASHSLLGPAPAREQRSQQRARHSVPILTTTHARRR